MLRRPLVLLAFAATLIGVVALASPGLLGDRLREALAGVREADARWLWVAALSLAAMHACGGFAWSAALRACGSRHRHGDVVVRYGIGSGVAAIAPAHLGSAARVALLSRIVEGRGSVWRIGGAAAAVAAVRSMWVAALVVLAAAQGAFPLWPLLVLGGGLALAAGVAIISRRVNLGSRVAHLLDPFRELGRSPRRLAAVAGFTCLTLGAKVAAAGAAAVAVGIDNPFGAAVLIVLAVELAGILPLTPGNAGVASAAVAFTLHAQGVPTDLAVTVGVAFAAVELMAALGVGALGALALAAPTVRVHARPVIVAASAGALAFALGGAVVA